jgi:hypothetical protein
MYVISQPIIRRTGAWIDDLIMRFVWLQPFGTELIHKVSRLVLSSLSLDVTQDEGSRTRDAAFVTVTLQPHDDAAKLKDMWAPPGRPLKYHLVAYSQGECTWNHHLALGRVGRHVAERRLPERHRTGILSKL